MKNLLLFLCLLLAINGYSIAYYVSPLGMNTNIGTSVDKPFQTIQFAVNKMNPGDLCLVMEGVYRETVVFTKSGSKDSPIIIRPYQNQKVVVTGLDKLTGWSKNADETFWKASMTSTLGRGKDQLFYNGEVMLEARFPNIPDKGLEFPVTGLSKLWPTFGNFSLVMTNKLTNYALTNPEVDAWKGANYYGVHNDGWAAQTGVVSNSSEGSITVNQLTDRWWFGGNTSTQWGRGMLTGHRLALDIAGEWLLEDGYMLFICPANTNPEGKVEVKQRHIAFNFSDASYIEVKNIQVKAASVCMANATYCKLDSCDMSYISHFTVFKDGRVGQIDQLYDSGPLKRGEVSIYISGHNNSIVNSKIQYSAGGGIYLDGYNHTVHNTLINEISYSGTDLAGIMIGPSEETYYAGIGKSADYYIGGHPISYCTICNSGRYLLNWVGAPQRDGLGAKYAACLISNNHIFNGVLQARDGGNIGCWWTDLGAYNGKSTEFFNNVMHDCFDPKGNMWMLGITYLDANSSNFYAHHNVSWASPGSVLREYLLNPWSLNIVWTKSTFFKDQSLDFQKLEPSHFPESKPFVFGHQAAGNPAIPISKELISINPVLEGTISMINNGKSFMAKSVDFSRGWQSVRMEYSSLNNIEKNDQVEFFASPTMKVRHHRPTDPLIIFSIEAESVASGVSSMFNITRFPTDRSWITCSNVPFGNGYKILNIL
jgi:hypothetical protein